MQAIVHQRDKLRRAMVATSSRAVQDWGKYLGDVTMVNTILDRLIHRCTMLEFQGKRHKPNEAAARLVAHAAASLPVISVFANIGCGL